MPYVDGQSLDIEPMLRTTDSRPTFSATAKGRYLGWALDAHDIVETRISGGTARYRPDHPLSPGTHVLTMTSGGPGWLPASAVVVVVA